MKLTIEIPLPPRALSPNARVHWSKKSAAAKMMRNLATNACLLAQNEERWTDMPGWETAGLSATFYFKDRRGASSDRDNLISSLKSAVDGIADSGLLADDHGVEWQSVVRAVDKSNPRVVLEITEIEDAH